MASLPSYARVLREGYAEQRESALLRTEMESGPPRQTKVKSRVMVTRPLALLFNAQTDYATFLTWYNSTISYGADWFDFIDPRTGSTVTARFVGGGLSAMPMGRFSGPWKVLASIETWG